MSSLRRLLPAALLPIGLVAIAGCLHAATLPPRLLELRNLGYAELENEQPAAAEAHYRALIELAPDDPLGHANLAIAALRQQNFEQGLEAVDRALELSPGDGRLLSIRGDLLQWSGESEAALAEYVAAADAAPSDVETQYALYRHLTTVLREPDESLIDRVLERLVDLRPENLVVMLQQGRRSLEAGDRATASTAFLRIGELLWQAPQGSDRLWDAVIAALEGDDLDSARLPAQRLENVLKITPMYRESLRELNTGIQGIPLTRLAGEPEPTVFGEPIEVSFRGRQLEGEAGVGAPVAGDFDSDGVPDLARLAGGEDTTSLKIRLSTAGRASTFPAAGANHLSALDLDNDGHLDLLAVGGGSGRFWKGDGAGSFADATEAMGLGGLSASSTAAIDFDIEGDLDLVVTGDQLGLLVNSLQGPLEARGSDIFPASQPSSTSAAIGDFDRDGDLDVALAGAGGVWWLDNLRQGAFTHGSTVADTDAYVDLESADLDNDGFADLVATGRGAALYRNTGGAFASWSLGAKLATSAALTDVESLDADNDGRLDLAFAGAGGVVVAAQRGGGLEFLDVEDGPQSAFGLAAADFDGDGDLDLAVNGDSGLWLLDNAGGNTNHWMTVQLRGLTKGNSKNNVYGLGSVVEVRAGAAYQFREAASDAVHFGLGSRERADLLRVVWTNGVPQNRIDPAVDQRIVEEQLLKGSCPFLYVLADGEVRFVTDLLWNAPVGLPLAPGVFAPADPQELVKIGPVAPVGGRWDLRITEELWEAAFFDYVRLWVVDHPADVEVASSLKVAPGEAGPDRVLGSRDVRALAGAWDARGEDVTGRVAMRDEVYADGWRRSPYQGVAEERWTFTFDLGEAPAAPVRLLLDGWIFPADASLNLAVAQRSDFDTRMPSLEVEVDGSWQPLIETIGHPAGKTKTMVVDTPPLPAGARRLRIVAGQWLSWDRIAWTARPDDRSARVVARLEPATADLAFRGFSRVVRRAPNAPHEFDYSVVSRESPWLPFPGRYTRFGDVRELLVESDDRSVIMAAGDEMRLTFDAASLPAPPAGWKRTLFLESHGWDKDADRNTFEGRRIEPLPFQAMETYGEAFPDTEWARLYRERWLTREVVASPEPR